MVSLFYLYIYIIIVCVSVLRRLDVVVTVMMMVMWLWGCLECQSMTKFLYRDLEDIFMLVGLMWVEWKKRIGGGLGRLKIISSTKRLEI